MEVIWFYAILSVLILSLISLIGVFTLPIKKDKLKKFLFYLVSFSAGALFGDAFLHLLPEVVEEFGFGLIISFSILSGIVSFFILEKIIHWHHCHLPLDNHDHVHRFALMNLVGDGFHNLIDGIIIGASYIVSLPAGIATTIAVGLHEIPQEIGDFGILIHGGFSKSRALILNFISALIAVFGVVIALLLEGYIQNIEIYLVPFAVGGFIYIAGSDLIPELHKEFTIKKSIFELVAFLLGVLVMALLLIVG